MSLVRPSLPVRALDACSQLANVLLLNGDANESISGRAYRCGWFRTERAINALLFWEPDHCRLAHQADVLRAQILVKSYVL